MKIRVLSLIAATIFGAIEIAGARGLGYGLDESALLTIQNRWKFQPGRRDGNPVSVEANTEVGMRFYR